MKKEDWIKKNSHYRFIYRRGKSYADRNVVVYVTRNKVGILRCGITVSKKVGNSVTRNRVKRLIREVIRKKYGNLKKGYDIVLVAREPASKADFYTIEGSINNLMKGASLLMDKETLN